VTDRSLRDRLREAGWRRAQDFSWRETAARTREAWMLAHEAFLTRQRT